MDYRAKFDKVFDLIEEYENEKVKRENKVVKFIKRLFGKDREKERLGKLVFSISDVILKDCPYLHDYDMFFKSQEDAELYCAENGIDLDWIE